MPISGYSTATGVMHSFAGAIEIAAVGRRDVRFYRRLKSLLKGVPPIVHLRGRNDCTPSTQVDGQPKALGYPLGAAISIAGRQMGK